ncbi:MAG: NAD-dependent epimerase/dehydratase family protein, partial [Phycisphaeraceae bacterium]
MSRKVLITGGAGFIGSHVADALLAAGYRVRALDSLEAQVHGESNGDPARRWPAHLAPSVERVVGDICDPNLVRAALRGCDAVIHLAAAVGVGQSMYEVRNYTRINDLGTATLLQALIEQPVRRLIVASSMSIYGEGLWLDEHDRPQRDVTRTLDQLRQRQWEPRDAQGHALHPAPTPETAPPQLASIYALSKYDQEQACLIVGRAYRMPTIALRLFNVYGPRQALSNPYTGVLAIFASRLLNAKPPLIFEDGGQRRDFVHVTDVARAFQLALDAESVSDAVFNIGSGHSCTVCEVAEALRRAMG